MMKGEAPVRKMICIRRRHEDLHVEEEWEPWEKLTQKGLRRKCVPARVNLTIYAQVRPKPDTHVPQELIHARPEADEVPESKRARMTNAETTPHDPSTDNSIRGPINNLYNSDNQNNRDHDNQSNHHNTSHELSRQQESEREVIDLVSQKHGPKFHDLKSEMQSWLLKVHRNMGHPSAAKHQRFCRQLGCPDAILQAIPDIRCSTCLETSQPKGSRTSAIQLILVILFPWMRSYGPTPADQRRTVSILSLCRPKHNAPNRHSVTIQTGK
jgi:hypothetical protein